MLLTKLKGKIHRVTVTEARVDYVGSITVDTDLLKAAGIEEYELVHVVNVNNGNRLETYTIAGEAGSGVICLNGAAAHCFAPGDKAIIMCYAQMDEQEAKNHEPQVVFVNEQNHATRITHYERHGQIA